MSGKWKALVARSRPTKARVANLTLTGAESGQPIGICGGPIKLAASLAGSVEPAFGLIVQYVCDEVLS